MTAMCTAPAFGEKTDCGTLRAIYGTLKPMLLKIASRGTIETGTPIHEMWMRLTIDDRLNILAVETHTDHAPYSICPEIVPNFQRLVGLQIGRGFRRKVNERLGGVHGCTHLVELLGPMATTAFQTMAGQRRIQSAPEPELPPQFLNTCHAHASDSAVVKAIYPKFYTGT